MSKKQIWLRDDERRLVVDCLEHLVARLEDASGSGDHHIVNRLARLHTKKSIRAVLIHFATTNGLPAPTTEAQP